jgi:tripartite-type tricarboxylate transporter receptor subunit TctC
MSSNSRVDRRGFLRNAGRTVLGASAVGGLGPWASSATAEEKFPARDINWIIYQAPGGSIDTTARIIQPYLERNGIKTNLEYVLGAGGRVARSKLYTARPDGYVMMTESAPGGAIDEVIGRAGYKASEFIPIYGWSVVSWQLCVKKNSPIQTFQQFADECKKRRVVVGTIGRSGSSHIQLAALQKELNLPFGMVHFEGSGKAYPAVLGGHVDAAISGPGSGSRMRDSLHFLAVTGEEREKALPDVATLKVGHARDQIWPPWPRPVPDRHCRTLSVRTRCCGSRCRRPAYLNC